MKHLSSLLIIFMLLLSLASPAAAVQTLREEGITSFDVEAPAGGVISTVNLDNIPPNFNASVTFDAFGEEYQLEIGNVRNYGYWTFDVSLTYPNSTVATTQLKSFQPFATDADIKIQYFYAEFDSIVDIDLFVGLLPLTASFTNPVSSDSEIGEILGPSGLTYTRLAYSHVSGDCTQPFDLKVYISNEEEFQAQREESIKEYLSGSTSLFFQWTWDAIIKFIEAIPGIGQHMALALIISAGAIDTIFFYINLFFIQYLHTTILTIEFFILSSAIIKTRRNGNIFQLIDRIIDAHVQLFEFVLKFTQAGINIFVSIVRMISQIVSAIKPI